MGAPRTAKEEGTEATTMITPLTIPDAVERTRSAIVRVGDGRGFVMDVGIDETRPFISGRIIVTAAHCLEFIPHPAVARDHTDATYKKDLIGPWDGAPRVWGACLFADAMADLAVLVGPDDQTYVEPSDRFEAWVGDLPAIPLGPFAPDRAAYVLGLDGAWVQATTSGAFTVHLSHNTAAWRLGMSGSPIVDTEGRAIGVFTSSSDTVGASRPTSLGNPVLAHHLPGWLVARLKKN